MKPLINLADVPLETRAPMFVPQGPAAERYDALVGAIGTRIGTRLLGVNVTVVPPGKRAFPRHNHQVNEELFVILAGKGELRFGERSHPVRPGDVIACPPGGPDTAHQLVNTGSAELRYLAISTRLTPEVVEYPDSGKFAVIADCAPNADGTPRRLRHIAREGASLDYWEGE